MLSDFPNRNSVLQRDTARSVGMIEGDDSVKSHMPGRLTAMPLGKSCQDTRSLITFNVTVSVISGGYLTVSLDATLSLFASLSLTQVPAWMNNDHPITLRGYLIRLSFLL